MVRPDRDVEHNAGLKIPAGVDVELMFEEGRLLCEKVLAEVDPASAEGELLQGAIDAAGDPADHRPPGWRSSRTRPSSPPWRRTRSASS